MPAIKAWLSLVGIPNHHAAVAHVTIATKAAQRAISASEAFPPKSTILYMVAATLAFIIVMTNTPIKLNTAAMIIAFVDTHVAIAFGASVHPFTRITAKVNRTVTARTGLDVTCSKKAKNEIVISRPLFT